jgi:hypothetical protein
MPAGLRCCLPGGNHASHPDPVGCVPLIEPGGPEAFRHRSFRHRCRSAAARWFGARRRRNTSAWRSEPPRWSLRRRALCRGSSSGVQSVVRSLRTSAGIVPAPAPGRCGRIDRNGQCDNAGVRSRVHERYAKKSDRFDGGRVAGRCALRRWTGVLSPSPSWRVKRRVVVAGRRGGWCRHEPRSRTRSITSWTH